MTPSAVGRTFRGSGLDRALPYLMLGPTLFLVLGVIVYPLIDGLRSSTGFFRFGRLVRSVGLDNYSRAFADPAFIDALLTTARFVFLVVTIETVLGLALALLVSREGRFIRRIRATLILPMIITPVVVGIVFRLIYASDVGLLASIAYPSYIKYTARSRRSEAQQLMQEISLKQVEAVRATGAPFMSVVMYAVAPQVFSRFVGFVSYETDANLRNSTMVGIVGAGGIGGTLFAAFQRFDYDYVCAILISIIALIMVGEILAMGVRAIFIDGLSLAELFRGRVGRLAARGERPLEDD